MSVFFHTTTPEQWAKYAQCDYYAAESLTTEGFIHGSYAEQLAETLSRHFRDVPLVLILTIDPALLTAPLKIETSRNGLLFPHVYGNINKSAIIAIEERELSKG